MSYLGIEQTCSGQASYYTQIRKRKAGPYTKVSIIYNSQKIQLQRSCKIHAPCKAWDKSKVCSASRTAAAAHWFSLRQKVHRVTSLPDRPRHSGHFLAASPLGALLTLSSCLVTSRNCFLSYSFLPIFSASVMNFSQTIYGSIKPTEKYIKRTHARVSVRINFTGQKLQLLLLYIHGERKI